MQSFREFIAEKFSVNGNIVTIETYKDIQDALKDPSNQTKTYAIYGEHTGPSYESSKIIENLTGVPEEKWIGWIEDVEAYEQNIADTLRYPDNISNLGQLYNAVRMLRKALQRNDLKMLQRYAKAYTYDRMSIFDMY